MEISDLTSNNVSRVLSEVSTIARQAARLLRRPVTSISAENNPSTDVDTAVSSFLKTALAKVLDLPILSEEGDFKYESRGLDCWIIDPVDGTLNLLSGSPDVAISIALVSRQQGATVAVVFLPFHDELFSAQIGQGSYLNGKRLHAKAQTRIVSYGLPGDAKEKHYDLMYPIQQCIEEGFFLRQSGSAAIDICRVAAGTWSAYFQRRLFIWDIAAADLVATEAGARSSRRIRADGITCDYVVSGVAINLAKFLNTIGWGSE